MSVCGRLLLLVQVLLRILAECKDAEGLDGTVSPGTLRPLLREIDSKIQFLNLVCSE